VILNSIEGLIEAFQMNKADKTKEELTKELLELYQSYYAIREQYDKEISLLKLALEKVGKSEENIRKVYETSPDAINLSRLTDGMYISVNEGFTKILGYTAEEVIGKTSIELNIWVDPENRKNLVNEIEVKGRVENFEAIFRKKDGSIINGLLSASLIDLDGIPHLLNIVRDVTFIKRVEKELAWEQFLVNALMDNLPDLVYFKDRESRFIRINMAQAKFLGINDPSQAVGKKDFDFFPGKDAQQAYEDEQNIIRTGQMLSLEEKETRPDSPDTWVSTVKLPLRDKEGNIICTFGISRDVTEQKKSEEQYFLLENALKNINECVYITDLNNRILFLNQAFLNTYGYSENDLKDGSISIIRSPNNPMEIIEEILPATLQGGWHGELLNRKKDGSEFLVSLSTVAVKNSQGQPIALIGVATDITSRKRTELENQIISEITQGITTTSNLDELLKLIHHSLRKIVKAENCFLALNNQKIGLFSFPYFVDKFDPKSMPDSVVKNCPAYVFRTVKPFLFNQEIFDQLNEQYEVEVVGSALPSWIGIPLQTPSKVIGVLVIQHFGKENAYSESDVRFLISLGSHMAVSIERKKAEEEIKLKNELLQAINADKDKFFSILAHDLRGPLSTFVGATRILTEEIQTMDMEEIKEITLGMKASATNIYSLLENLLEWSQLKRGAMDFMPEKLNLKEKIEACIDVLSESARKKRIELTYSIPGEMEVFADNHMFDSVIRNLVSNAIKFTHVGGKVSITADRKSDQSIMIKISDSGIGMTPELKNKLFQLNEMTSRTGTEGEPSTGLGLLLCKEFIEKQGGKIWVESEVGKGSTFSFTVPARS
jgi:PAS domain S-box-containing protein